MGINWTISIGLVVGAFVASCPDRVSGWYGSAQGAGASWPAMDVRAAHVPHPILRNPLLPEVANCLTTGGRPATDDEAGSLV